MQEKPLFFEGNPPVNRGFWLIFVEKASDRLELDDKVC